MALDFIITVDTEADNQWQKNAPLSVNNLKFIPRFQDLCEKYGFIPTYLLTYEVAADKEFTAWLKNKYQSGLADLGAHLHPWSNPPFNNDQERELKTFPCELSVEEVRAKVAALTEIIKTNLGVVPTIFRAGRWGISSAVMKELKAQGYQVDSSVTPFIDWSKLIKNALKEMNFQAVSPVPYEWQGLIEVPMTIVPVPRLIFGLGSFSNKLFYKKVWGRFFPKTSANDLKQAFFRVEKMNWPYFQFMTHSSELMPGGSIYNKTKFEVENFYSKLEVFFTFLTEQKVISRGLSAVGKKE